MRGVPRDQLLSRGERGLGGRAVTGWEKTGACSLHQKWTPACGHGRCWFLQPGESGGNQLLRRGLTHRQLGRPRCGLSEDVSGSPSRPLALCHGDEEFLDSLLPVAACHGDAYCIPQSDCDWVLPRADKGHPKCVRPRTRLSPGRLIAMTCAPRISGSTCPHREWQWWR